MQRSQQSERSRNELDEIRSEAESILKELGFSSHAARSFVVISENSPLTATTLCQKTGIADSKIYYALKELEEKQVVIKAAGTPQLYSMPKSDEVCGTIRTMLESDHRRKEAKLARLGKILKPLSESSVKSDNLEIAYISRGLDNVTRRALKLLDAAEKHVVGYIWDERLYEALFESLEELLTREVKLELALNPHFLRADVKGGVKQKMERGPLLPIIYPTNGKILLCECNLLVVDRKKMISMTRTRADTYYAIITEDPGMVALGNSYYENPTCCAFGR